MKKYINYIGILLIGLLLGWLLFGGTSKEKTKHNHDKLTEINQMWTCSMHPQIMKEEPGSCPICGMDLILAESNSDGLLVEQFELTENAIALANIQTSIVGNGTIDDNSIKLTGEIVENENTTATISAHFNARIEKLYIKSLGQYVEKGEAIAEVYSPELIAAQQELIATYRSKETEPKLYTAVKSKFNNWMIHDAQLEQIVQTAKVNTKFTIYSHVSGVVTEIFINEGAHMMDGKPIFKVSNLNTVWANFNVYENQIDLFHTGQEIEINTNASRNKCLKAKVDFMDPILNKKTRTLTLRAVLKNKDKVFKPGMFITGNVQVIKTENKIVTIPSSAVLWTGERSVVYLKTKPDQNVFELQEVVLGNKIGDGYELLEGLAIGNEIVTNGTFTVDAAAQLKGKKSMMNKGSSEVGTDREADVEMNNDFLSKENKHSAINNSLEISKKFQEGLHTVFNDYVNLKDAFTKENSENIYLASRSMLNDLSKVDIKLLSNSKAYTYWLSLAKELKSSITTIAATAEIKVQRARFKQLSSQLLNAVQFFGVNEIVYVKFCPMADNDQGAYWLSKEKKIANPYFGKAMHNCGEVVQEIEY